MERYFTFVDKMHEDCYNMIVDNPHGIPKFIKKSRNPGYAKKVFSKLIPFDFAFEFDIDNFSIQEYLKEKYDLKSPFYNSQDYSTALGVKFLDCDGNWTPAIGVNDEHRIRIGGYPQAYALKDFCNLIQKNGAHLSKMGGNHLHIDLGLGNQIFNRFRIAIGNQAKYVNDEVTGYTKWFYSQNDSHHGHMRNDCSPEQMSSYSFGLSRDHNTVEVRSIMHTMDYKTLIKCVIGIEQMMRFVRKEIGAIKYVPTPTKYERIRQLPVLITKTKYYNEVLPEKIRIMNLKLRR